MATEYISREAAISEILSEPTDAHYPSWYAEKLKDIPAADVRPVARAKWDVVEKPLEKATICECSECKNRIWMYDGDDGWNFCPNCGADMREAKKDG